MIEFLAANQRQVSESEIRYFIDAQLRRFGREADTETLRYSKGVRPAKGRALPPDKSAFSEVREDADEDE